MGYQETVARISEIERRIMPDLQKMEHEGELPHSLRSAKDAILEWKDDIDGKHGLEDAPKIGPVEEFARALKENEDLFNAERREDIEELQKYTKELKEEWNSPLA